MHRIHTYISKRAANDGGAVAILVALLLIVLVGFGAFAVDMGYAYAVKRQQSVTVDSAALAGAQAVGLKYKELYPGEGPGCQGLTANEPDEVHTAARLAATENYANNDPEGEWADPQVVVDCDSDNPDNFNVTVTGSSTLPTLLGGVLGKSDLTPGAQATAQVSGSPAYTGLRPFAICEQDRDDAVTNPTSVQYSLFDFQSNGNEGQGNGNGNGNNGGEDPGDDTSDESKTRCSVTSPGNWGVVDFDEGSNGNPDIADWIRNGYGGPVTIPDPGMDGDPGQDLNSNGVRDALDSILGKTVMFPVARNSWTGGGNNAEFKAVGVVSAKFCGWYISDNKSNAATGCTIDDDVILQEMQAAIASAAPANVDLVLAWQYVAHADSFEGGGSDEDGCSLADSGCPPTIRLWR